MKSNWRARVFLIFAAVCGVVAAASGVMSPGEAGEIKGAVGTPSAPVKTVLQLKWKHQFQFAGYYAALEKGYYRQAGLEVEIVEAGDGEFTTDKVFRGEADFGVAMSDLALLKGRGLPVVVLAAIDKPSPLGVLALKKSGIESIRDLAGKRIMFEPDSADLETYLAREGVSRADLTVVPYSPDVAKLAGGDVDAMSAYWTDEPYLLHEKGLDYVFFSPREDGVDFYGDCLFTTREMVERKPELVEAFLAASLEGWRYALERPDEIIELILSKYSRRHSREHLKYEADTSRMLIIPGGDGLGAMSPERWRSITDAYAKMKMIPPDINLEGFIYEKSPR
ncbi:MAG: ABC transporter substrate-binding protein [Pseudomonadota bacterium]